MIVDDPVLARLMAAIERAQADLKAYLATGKAPTLATALVDDALVPLAKIKALVPWSDDTIRRHVSKNKRLGRMVGKRWFVNLPEFKAYLDRMSQRKSC